MIEQPKAQYRQLADRLRARIHNGDYPRTSRLPSELDLAAEYGVSRQTVNRAVTMLRNEGLVRAERGVGVVVTAIPPVRRNAVARYRTDARERAGARGAFDTEIRALGMTPRVEYRRVERVTPPPAVAAALGLETGTPNTLVRDRRMWADSVPMQVAASYIPWEIAEGTQIAEQDSGPGGIISRFAELGLTQTRISERVTVRTPTDDEAHFLAMDADQLVYAVTHIGWTADDRPVEVTVHVMPVHLWELDYEWPTD
ncbi:MAG TPA: GntR family transcriptional regulator [Streptosporangiaceae bacterium]|jgi:GntR family transcriptional regulator